jgi:glycerol uptake facilitator-like aquaporin
MKKNLAEFFGTALLLMAIVGSGLMGFTLSDGNSAMALLVASIITGISLFILVTLLISVSGAYFNPLVSFMMYWEKKIKLKEFFQLSLSQVLGAIVGVAVIHSTFDIKLLQLSNIERGGIPYYLSEIISSMVLLSVIYFGSKKAKQQLPFLIGLTVMCGHWIASSTFFANPAVTIGRMFTNSFAGIQYVDGGLFILSQMIGLIIFIAIFVRRKSTK